MKSKGGFFSGLIVFFLVVVILGGVGFLGYNIIFKGNMGMSSMNMTSNSTQNKSTDNNTDTTNANDTSNNSMNMSSNSSSDQANMGNSSSTGAQNNYKLSQVNTILLNKDALDKALTIINDSLKQMTLDPYAVSNSAQDNNQQEMNNNQQGMNNNQQNETTTDTTQGNTTVNVYTAPNNQTMQTMGQTYDTTKMQQLHTGLYKVSVGMQLLNQLKDNITVQVEQASIDANSMSEYYLSQYYTTIQNKNKLTEALGYLNQAADLININPYIDANGAVYDKERMTQLHDSIFKLAQGVVDLNKLNDNLLKQAVKIGNLAQNSYDQGQMNNMNMSTNGGLFGNISFSTIFTILLIAFVVIFILALLGSVLKLFKPARNEQ